MQGCVHIVDDDASFRTAMERRLTKAGYEVATYPSALHLLVNLPTESIPSCILLDVRIPRLGRSGTAEAPSRTRFDAANHFPHWLSGYPRNGTGR